MPVGQLVRLYRIDRKKSAVNVATLAGITVHYLEMIEAGTKTPSLPVLRKLAKMLGVRTSALIGEAPSENHEARHHRPDHRPPRRHHRRPTA
jgi:transcriptional regulator with XRE-family HTH domain